jgi:flagellar biosynthesis protein FlhF
MRIKSYFVKSVDEAIAQARAELGEDALLLSTRKVDARPDSPGGYDVVFGSTEPLAPEAADELPPAPVESPAPAEWKTFSRDDGNRDGLKGELDRLRVQMDEIHRLLLSSGGAMANGHRLPELAGVFVRLVGTGIDSTLADEIVRGVEAALALEAPPEKPKNRVPIGWKSRRFPWNKFEEALRAELSSRVKIDATLGAGASGGTVVAMVGPGGAGKTTTLMKIAAFQAAPGRPVRLLTLDSAGLGSRMQLQFFARKTGITFTTVETPEALPELIENARKKEIVLIDTPSCASGSDREKLAGIFANCRGVDVHLVLPGYMTASALREAIRKYSVFHPAKLVVTKLDEAATFGAAVSEAVHAGLSLSLVTNGVSIPADVHAASVDDLVSIALGREQAEVVCA